MKIGVLIKLNEETDIKAEFQKAIDMDLHSCQLCCWNMSLYTDEKAREITDAVKETGMEITALWAGWSGPRVWDFYDGPLTLGLVPEPYRFQRLQELFQSADFAKKINVSDLITHAGFIPENPTDQNFRAVVAALRNLAQYMEKQNQYFLFETGQETPITMLRTIEEIGTSNLGINFDTANLIIYGKSNAVDAVDVFGKYIRNTHIKDGVLPVCGRKLGEQVPLGEGRANIPAIIEKLKELGYNGALTIEREITGQKQIEDIIAARDMLKALIQPKF